MKSKKYIYTKPSSEWNLLYIEALENLIEYQSKVGDLKSVRNDNDELTYQNVLEVLRSKQNLVNNLKKQYELALAWENGEMTELKENNIGILYIPRSEGY